MSHSLSNKILLKPKSYKMYQNLKVDDKKEMFETQQEINNLTCTWPLVNLHLHKAKRSTQFSSKTNMNPIWYLSLKTPSETSDYFGIYLNMSSCLNNQVRGQFKFSLVNKAGEVLKTKTGHTINFKTFIPYGFDKFLKKSYSLITDNELKVVCEIRYIINRFDFFDQQGIRQQKEAQKEFSKNFQKVLENGKFSDVTLLVDGEKFRAHKLILSARSEVFAAMFEHEMEENKTSCVVIKDISSEVFREVLRFIYTGNALNLEELAMDLLTVADMYALKILKQMCEQMISANLSIETSVATLILADLHSSKELKSNAIHFINAHANDVMKTESWQNMKKSSFNYLIVEAYQVMASERVKRCKGCMNI